MKVILNFLRGKIDRSHLKFHYLRVGKAAPLLDDLRAQTEEQEIEWVQHETDTFIDYHFGDSYYEYDGAIVNLGLNEDNVSEFRRQFWENFIWQTQKNPLPVAIVIPDTMSFGSMTKGTVKEALSLIRLTDRPFDLFENIEDELPRICDFLTGVSSVIHRKQREEETEIKKS